VSSSTRAAIAVVSHLAGAATVTAPLSERQLPSLVFVLQHVDTEALGSGPRVALLRSLVTAEQEGRLPKGAANPGAGLVTSARRNRLQAHLERNRRGASRESRFLTVAEQEGRKRALAVTEFLKTLPAFSRAFVSHAAPQVGVRESRRVIGRYQLTRDDVLGARKFDDGVARASWPIELWEEGRLGAAYEWLDERAHYEHPAPLPAGPRRRQPLRGRPLHERHARSAGLGARDRYLPGDRRGGRPGGGTPRGDAMNLADLLFATAERHSPRRAGHRRALGAGP